VPVASGVSGIIHSVSIYTHVADPEDRARRQGAEPPLDGLGAKPPTQEAEVNAFCVMVKAFS